MNKIIFILAFVLVQSQLIAQPVCDLNNYSTIYVLNANDYPYLTSSSITVASATTGGVTTLANFTYNCGTNPYATNAPAYWLNAATQSWILTFSVPVTNFTLVQNGSDAGEVVTVTPATGTATIPTFCTNNFTVAGNAITCIGGGPTGTIFTINNPTGSLVYTITHNGTGSGSRIALMDCVTGGCPPIIDTQTVVICEGQTYQVGTSNYSTPGTYTDSFKIDDDCDSVVTTILTVNPTYNTYLDTAIYEGDSVTIAGIHHKFEGTYNYRWQTTLGCDSNFTLRLKVIPWKLDTLKPHICIGEKFYLDTIMYDRTGVYFDTFRYEWGHHFYRTELTVHPLPIITITPNPKNPDFICVHDSLDITAKGAVYYEWYYITPKEELRFGDTTDKQTAYLSYDNTTIRVFGRDEWNCENTNEVSIKGERCCNIFAPSAFSPNGDGLNDKFEVYSQSLPHEYRLEVFNRYGQSIFVSNNLRHQWDGTLHNGDFAPNDTYFYIISGKCSNFEPIFQKGDITLIR